MENDTMQEVEVIYKNEFGMGFFWKKQDLTITNKIQVIFRDTGFYLTIAQIHMFVACLEKAKTTQKCNACTSADCCRSILLKTPSPEVDLAINKKELLAIDDLLNGLMFQLSLREYLRNNSFN